MEFFDSFHPFGRGYQPESTYRPNRQPVRPQQQTRSYYPQQAYRQYPQQVYRRNPYYEEEEEDEDEHETYQARNPYQRQGQQNLQFQTRPQHSRQAGGMRRDAHPHQNQREQQQQQQSRAQNDGIRIPIRRVHGYERGDPPSTERNENNKPNHNIPQQQQSQENQTNKVNSQQQSKPEPQKSSRTNLKSDKVAVDRSVLSENAEDKIFEELPIDQVKISQEEEPTSRSPPGELKVSYLWEDEDDQDSVIETVVDCPRCVSPVAATQAGLTANEVLSSEPVRGNNEMPHEKSTESNDNSLLNEAKEDQDFPPVNASGLISPESDWVHIDDDDETLFSSPTGEITTKNPRKRKSPDEEVDQDHQEQDEECADSETDSSESSSSDEESDNEASEDLLSYFSSQKSPQFQVNDDEIDAKKWLKELEILKFLGFEDTITLTRLLNDKIGHPEVEKSVKQRGLREILKLLL